MAFLKQLPDETEYNHSIRIMGTAPEWVFNVKAWNISVDNNTAWNIYDYYQEIQTWYTKDLKEELWNLVDSNEYKSRDYDGVWTRTCSFIIDAEIDRRLKKD